MVNDKIEMDTYIATLSNYWYRSKNTTITTLCRLLKNYVFSRGNEAKHGEMQYT